MGSYLQKILFGSPGTGKSYKVRQIAANELGIILDPTTQTSSNIIKTVFHPEYTYGDFMGKLLPYGQGSSVTYRYYPGHFLKALGRAYRSILDSAHFPTDPEATSLECLLVIDELNRGNSSAIFGTIFQLLDREKDGWSSYEIDLSDLEIVGLLNSMGYAVKVVEDELPLVDRTPFDRFIKDLDRKINSDPNASRLLHLLNQHKISLPPNLSIIATINTSDESIYYLDSAFKRRWNWEYIAPPQTIDDSPDDLRGLKLKLSADKEVDWPECIVALNNFIRSQHQSIRRIEDKQIGWWFIKPLEGDVTIQQIEDKVLFYLWDTVFSRDRRPLEKLLSEAFPIEEVKLITFDDLTKHSVLFIEQVLKSYYPRLG